MIQVMCPSCGRLFDHCTLIPTHSPAPPTREVCSGSGQCPRNPESDRRPLWNGLPNPHIEDGPGPQFPVTTTTTGEPVPQLCHFQPLVLNDSVAPLAAFTAIAVEHGKRVIVNSRLHTDDLIGRVLAGRKGFCADCGRELELADTGAVPFHWVADGGNWKPCGGHDKPPTSGADVPHVVESK